MLLEQYKELIAGALDLKRWDYSSKLINQKQIIFNCHFFINKKRERLNCLVAVEDNGVCEMYAKLPFKCPGEKIKELCYVIAECNRHNRFTQFQVNTENGEIYNYYSFEIIDTMSEEYILYKFLLVKVIDEEDDDYRKIQNICKVKLKDKIENIVNKAKNSF